MFAVRNTETTEYRFGNGDPILNRQRHDLINHLLRSHSSFLIVYAVVLFTLIGYNKNTTKSHSLYGTYEKTARSDTDSGAYKPYMTYTQVVQYSGSSVLTPAARPGSNRRLRPGDVEVQVLCRADEKSASFWGRFFRFGAPRRT